jgi:hypothetical protein
MRAALKYGVPAAAGLATGGYALSQGEDPGSALLAGLGGAAGGAAGLLGARLAGKYAPAMAQAAQERVITPMANIVGDIGAKVPAESKTRNKAIGQVADVLAAAEQSAMGPGAQRMVGKLTAGLGVPAAAGLAGLGGIAAGAIPGAMGVPGFQQNVIADPELATSSNTQMARSYTPTLRYLG